MTLPSDSDTMVEAPRSQVHRSSREAVVPSLAEQRSMDQPAEPPAEDERAGEEEPTTTEELPITIPSLAPITITIGDREQTNIERSLRHRAYRDVALNLMLSACILP